jgi:cytochrome c oxidase subunit 4
VTPPDMEHAPGHDLQAHPVHVKGYLAVFGALMVLTLVTVAVSYLQMPMTPTVLVALAIASVKAALVAMFFMHLKGERPMVYWSLALTAVLFVALFAFLLWSEGDHLFGTRFEDAFDEGAAAPRPQPAEGAH